MQFQQQVSNREITINETNTAVYRLCSIKRTAIIDELPVRERSGKSGVRHSKKVENTYCNCISWDEFVKLYTRQRDAI